MSKLEKHVGLLIVIVLVILFYTHIPLTTASLFGDDEGCELMKAAMVNKGYALYTDIWNDQPPIFTLLLSYVFKIFGTSLVAGRLVAAGFGLLLFGSFYWLVAQRLGQWMGMMAVFLLMAAPEVAALSASAMLEVPAFATALLATCLLFQWTKQPRIWWLVASGIVMGFALQIKLTAVLVAPAMIVEIFLACESRPNQPRWKATLSQILPWGTTVAVTVVAIIMIWARGSIATALKSHFGEHPPAGMISPQDFPFQTDLLGNHIECVIAAVIAVFLVAQRAFHPSQKAKVRAKDRGSRHKKAQSKIQKTKFELPRAGSYRTMDAFRQMVFPIIFLLTVSCIHTVHRPWWSYYYLHLAIPLAWLSAWVVGEAISFGGQFLSASGYNFGSSKTWQAIALCLLAALVLVRSERRLEVCVKDLRVHVTVADDPLVAKMKKYASHTHWVYAEHEIYPFHAGLITPPELTVVVLKRFWSQQISTSEIVETCKRSRTEQILLDPTKIGSEWNNFLDGYDIAYQNSNVVLYIAKSIE